MSDPLLSLCMIVRDEERTLGNCLASIRPWVDEMVVVDTGSRDATVEIAERHGARVSHFPWCDDFSAARNASLAAARGSWLFWMDADDTIDEQNGRKLQQLVRRDVDDATLGYVLQVHCPSEQGSSGAPTVVDHIKIFRNREDLRFEGRIHEQILPAIRQADGNVEWTDVFVVHSGHDYSAPAQQRKLQRDLRLIALDLQDRPDHPFVLFNLGMTLAHADQPAEAVEALERCLKLSDPGESHVRKAFALLISCFGTLNRPDAAEHAIAQALRHYPDDAELLFRLAPLLQQRGQLEQAADVYREILKRPRPEEFASVDQGIFGHLTHHNLATVLVELGFPSEAERHWREALRLRPEFAPAWRGLGDALLRQGRFREADELGQSLIADDPGSQAGQYIRADVARAMGRHADAIERLEQLACGSPQEAEPLDLLCQVLVEAEQWGAAVERLQQLVERTPNASAYRNLGHARLQLGDAPGAIAALEQSLRLRPEDESTRSALQTARQLLC